MNTYVMGLRPSYIFNSFSEGIVFRRQNLTFKDGPRAERDVHKGCMVLLVLFNALVTQFQTVLPPFQTRVSHSHTLMSKFHALSVSQSHIGVTISLT